MIEWQWSAFASLRAADVYAMLALRSEVFVLEQACLYQDIDGLDLHAWHLLGWHQEAGERRLCACLRVLPAGLKFTEISLGRVVTSPEWRGRGVGQALLRQGLACLEREYGAQPVRIAAQHYLLEFYRGFGFVVCSDTYDEDGILHVDMLRTPELAAVNESGTSLR